MKKNRQPVVRQGSKNPPGSGHVRVERNGATVTRQNRRKRNKPRWPLLIPVLILLLVAYLLARSLWPGNHTSGTTTGQTDTTEPVTTPAASGTASPTSGPTAAPTPLPTQTPVPSPAALSAEQRESSLQAAAAEVSALLSSYSRGRFAVYFMNLAGGETWGYQDEEPFVAASSIKIGINTHLYTQIEAGQISLDEILKYDSRPYPTGDYESGTGTIQNLPNGSELTVRETSGLSIRISDNCGTNMVIRRLGGIDAINPWLNSLSGAVDYRQRVSYTNYAGQAQNGRHRTCARDLAMHTAELYRLWQDNPSVYDPLIDDLCTTAFDFGIHKGIPDGIRVAHKIGTNGLYATENDVGIVFCEEPFVLCVMTEMANAGEARKIQAEIAAIFYRHVGKWPWA